MKKRKLVLFSAIVLMTVSGIRCGTDCAATDCGNPIVPLFSFRLVNAAGKDLIGSSAKIYDSANVKILAKRTSTGVIENVKRNFSIIADTNYITAFVVNKNYSAYYLSLNNTVTDSLIFGFTSRQTDCCDKSYFSLTKVNTSDITPPLILPQNSYPIVK